MPDPLSPVAAGQPLGISAQAWNLVTAAARDRRQPPRDPDPVRRGLDWGGVIVARAVNDTGADLRENRPATVTGIGGYELPEGGADWQRRPVLTLGVPARATDWVCVTLEAIPAGETGAVAIDGIVLCEVDVGSGGTATYARPTPGSTDSLTGGSRGPIRVLHVPAAEGSTRRCVVYLRESITPDKWVTDVCPVGDAYGAVVGIALFEEHSDGRGRCVIRGNCEDCGEADVPPSPPAPCVTVSGTVKLQPEDTGTYTGLYLTAYGGFFSAVTTGAYTLDLGFHSAGLGFTCAVPEAEDPRSVYYSTDAGASWTLATDIGLPSDGFMYDLPAECEPAEVLWELWADGYAPEVIVSPPAPPVPPVPPPPISPPVSPPPP